MEEDDALTLVYHAADEQGRPAGGVTQGRGFTIAWQNGPLGSSKPGEAREEPNGAFVEDVIKAAVNRLEFYQSGEFASDYNQRAILNLRKALDELDARTADRVERGVEGTHEV